MDSHQLYLLARLILVLNLPLVNVHAGPAPQPNKPEVSYGVDTETDESWLVYQKVAPIIYEYETPASYKNFLSGIYPKYRQPCPQRPTTGWYAEWCPVLEGLRQLGTYLESAISLNTLTSLPESEQLYYFDSNCDRLFKSFPSLRTEGSVLEDYLRNLENCAGPLFLRENGTVAGSTFAEVFKSLKGPEKSETEANSVVINTNVIQSALGYLIYFAESQRWKGAISDCKAGTIPSTLVQKTQLQASLLTLESILMMKYDMQLVLGKGDSEIGSYYKQRLTDCTFSGTKLIVRILVPVREASRQLYQLRSLPFLSSNDGQGQVCLIAEFQNERNLVYDFISNSALDSDCADKSELCYSAAFPNSNSFYNQNECAKALFSYPVQSARFETACPMTCKPVSPESLPLIRSLGGNGYHIVGQAGKSFLVERDENGTEALEATVFDVQKAPEGKNNTSAVPFPDFGAIQVTLPCNSRLLIETAGGGSNLTFFSKEPCVREVGLKHVQLYQLTVTPSENELGFNATNCDSRFRTLEQKC